MGKPSLFPDPKSTEHPFMQAIRESQGEHDEAAAEEIRRCFEGGVTRVDINMQGRDGSMPLLLAILCGHTHVFDLLMDHEYLDVHATWKDGGNALHEAACRSREYMLKRLLKDKRNLDVNNIDNHGWSVVAMAVFGNNVDVMREILKHNPNLETRDTAEDGSTPLLAAAFENQSETIAMLLANGADVLAQTDSGQYAWDLTENDDCLELLEKARLERMARDEHQSLESNVAPSLGRVGGIRL
jgi:ankyrin repeat protein